MSPASISVVIPLYQDAASIGACIASLKAQSGVSPLEILVVDDGSRDGGAEIAEAAGARVIRQKNAGPAAARNRGAELARGEIIAFLDSDCLVEPDWLAAVARHFENPATSAILCRLVPATAGIVPAIVQAEIDERYGMLKPGEPIDFLAGAAFAARAEAFRAVGGFHEAYRGNEDVELAFSLNAKGYRILFAADAPVAHHHQERWRDFLRAKFSRGVWRMRLYRAFPEKQRADSWTPMSLKIQILAACLIGPALLAGLVFRPALWLAALLLGIIAITGAGLIASTSRALKPHAGFAAPFWALFWVIARAITLAAAVGYSRLKRWEMPKGGRRLAAALALPMLIGLGAMLPQQEARAAEVAITIQGEPGAAPPAVYAFGAGVWRVPRVQRWLAPRLAGMRRPGLYRAALAWEVLAASRDAADLEARLKAYPLNAFLAEHKRRGGEVIITLDAMPRWLAANASDKPLPDGPAWAKSAPRDLGGWAGLVEKVVRHFDGELGLGALYEVWNEPDWSFPGFEAYMDLYQASAQGARRANPGARLAGPALSDSFSPARKGEASFFLKRFLQEARQRGLPVSAVTWHVFYRDPSRYYDLAAPIIRTWLGEAGFPRETPLIVDEWNIVAEPPYAEGDLNASASGAANVASSLIAMARNGIRRQSFQMIADPGRPGYSGGAFTLAGLPRAPAQAFRLFDRLDGQALAVQTGSPWVSAVAYARGSRLQVLVSVLVPSDGMILRSAFETLATSDLPALRELQAADRNTMARHLLKDGPRPPLGAAGARALDQTMPEVQEIRRARNAFAGGLDLMIRLPETWRGARVTRYEVLDKRSLLGSGEAEGFGKRIQGSLVAAAPAAKRELESAGLRPEEMKRWGDEVGKAPRTASPIDPPRIREAYGRADAVFGGETAGILQEISASIDRRALRSIGQALPASLRSEPQAVHLIELER